MKRAQAAVVGGDTLLGRELRDQMSQTHFPAEAKLVGADEEVTGILSVQGDEPIVIPSLDPDILESSKVIFLTAAPAVSERVLALWNKNGAPPIVDLTRGLEDQPSARLEAPLMTGEAAADTSIHVVAHPGAILIATLVSKIRKAFPVRHIVVQMFEPASERGQAGLNELQQQTTSLLSFRPLEKGVYDTQLSFNMVARFGEDAPEKLEDIEQLIDRHVATLLGEPPMPSIRLIQAPLFHGYSASFWVEFENNPGPAALSEALASEHVEVRGTDLDAPSNVGTVGQSGITVGLVEADRNNPRAIWLWAVADNFRLVVDNALEIARQVVPAAEV
jgi:aspartate-semialdehyde dehydrogenase